MRNRLCFDIWNDMSRTPYDTKYENRNGTEGVFVEVFVNGEYNGLYCMTDKIDRKLLGLKKAKVTDDGDVTVKGLLYKGNVWNDCSDIYLLSYKETATDKDTWNAWELQYPDDYPSIAGQMYSFAARLLCTTKRIHKLKATETGTSWPFQTAKSPRKL